MEWSHAGTIDSIQTKKAYDVLSQTPFAFVDGDVVAAHIPPPHIPTVIELPLLIAMSAVPLPLFIMPLVLEASADAVSL